MAGHYHLNHEIRERTGIEPLSDDDMTVVVEDLHRFARRLLKKVGDVATDPDTIKTVLKIVADWWE
jgi:hypothetical protein